MMTAADAPSSLQGPPTLQELQNGSATASLAEHQLAESLSPTMMVLSVSAAFSECSSIEGIVPDIARSLVISGGVVGYLGGGVGGGERGRYSDGRESER